MSSGAIDTWVAQLRSELEGNLQHQSQTAQNYFIFPRAQLGACLAISATPLTLVLPVFALYLVKFNPLSLAHLKLVTAGVFLTTTPQHAVSYKRQPCFDEPL